ncbi:MAG: bacillithiol biosynthesis deacetylase BshB1 [Cyclobacteriaceae bacterium]|nr:bacillithiol biosynthesis deacetylase BshB1 [Cyclobacteriaceae bacterium]MCH8516083.1 bacillithiol biosynthesis deacetylase BshB1 [Cyclobacteriaceae bacterium]
MKLDILVFAAHPDDAELSCSGTIATHVKKGYKVGIVELTQGEMGTRGTVQIRQQEAAASSEILGISARENLMFPDALFENTSVYQMKVVEAIRKYQPKIILANAPSDRHPDHGRASELVRDAVFMAGLAKLETYHNGEQQAPWRPENLYFYIQSMPLTPDFVVDITDEWETKMQAIKAFKSQFFDPNSDEPDTYISSPEFLQMIEARAREFGHVIRVAYGEGFIKDRYIGVRDLGDLI